MRIMITTLSTISGAALCGFIALVIGSVAAVHGGDVSDLDAFLAVGTGIAGAIAGGFAGYMLATA